MRLPCGSEVLAAAEADPRGIVVFGTFNEGEEVTKPSGRTEVKQWTVNLRDGQPRGFACSGRWKA